MTGPTKAAYEAFDDDRGLEFEFYLCRALGWRSVTVMRACMSQAEFVQWSVFYGREYQHQQMAAATRRR